MSSLSRPEGESAPSQAGAPRPEEPSAPHARPSGRPAVVPNPPPLEANDQLVAGVITGGWAIALVVLLIVRDYIPPAQRWWIWTTALGFGMGVFGLWYVPYLKRARARSARRRSGTA